MSEDHNCANCKDKDTPSSGKPCNDCMMYGTKYPYWKARVM